ncbi:MULTISPECIES: LysR family transcriptional regulator [Sorangium]|uniref:LysR family transcriptional regulator n=1 Tax=Sorangium TaxID=39643 RepID=UPI003D9C4CFF
MADADLNLLTALDALLAEGSVAGAARTLGISSSAMSRTFARLRAVTGDPLLVRAGRGLVPTPHAAQLRERVRNVAREAHAVLAPAPSALDLARLERTFNLRASDGFVEVIGPRLIATVVDAAPKVRLRFAPKPNKDVQALRDGAIDLEIGVLGQTGPEVQVQALFHDQFVGAVREGHPLVTEGEVSARRYAEYGHVVVSRRGSANGPVDEALAALGLTRTVVAVVPDFAAAVAFACASDLVALVTRSYLARPPSRDVAQAHPRVRSFPLPVVTKSILVSQMWHPRMDADPGHRWLRGLVLTVCRAMGLSDARPAGSSGSSGAERRARRLPSGADPR